MTAIQEAPGASRTREGMCSFLMPHPPKQETQTRVTNEAIY